MSHSALLATLAALPFIGALLLSLMRNDQPRRVAWAAGLSTLLGCGLLAVLVPQVFAGEVLRWSIEWLPALGLRLGFRMDGLAFLFALLVLGIGALVVLYAAYYLDPKDPPARFFSFLLLFMGAMLGVVLADNRGVLGTDQPVFFLADWLLACRCRQRQRSTSRRPHGAHHHRGGGTVFAGRISAHWKYGGQL
jgi:multicomponent K+:H+ antiporter subunit A